MSAFRSIVSDPSGYAVADWTEPPCPGDPMPVAPLHRHTECDEGWVVLEGALVVRAGEQEVLLHPGDALIVPRGTPHTYWNPDPVACRYLLFMTGRTQRLIEAIHAAQDRSPERMRALFDAHGAQLL